jgi:hypothetical protein
MEGISIIVVKAQEPVSTVVPFPYLFGGGRKKEE